MRGQEWTKYFAVRAIDHFSVRTHDDRYETILCVEDRSAGISLPRHARQFQHALALAIFERDLAAQLMGELQAAQQRLQLRVAEFERGAAVSGAPTLPLKPFRGDLDWPLDGRVLAGFGLQRNARFNTAIVSNGLRIAAAAGTAVHAVHDGTVVFAEPFSGFGNLLIVDHGGQAFTMYGSLDTMAAQAGAHVARGQVVGTSGAALDGMASLYFELRVDGRPVNPLQWLKKR